MFLGLTAISSLLQAAWMDVPSITELTPEVAERDTRNICTYLVFVVLENKKEKFLACFRLFQHTSFQVESWLGILIYCCQQHFCQALLLKEHRQQQALLGATCCRFAMASCPRAEVFSQDTSKIRKKLFNVFSLSWNHLETPVAQFQPLPTFSNFNKLLF